MVGHHPAKFGGPKHCSIGHMFLLVDSTSSRINPPLLLTSKAHGLKAHGISC